MLLALLLIQSELGPPDVLQESFATRMLWASCGETVAESYAKLSEGAETIADVAMTKCAPIEPKLKALVERLTISASGMKFDEDHVNKLVLNERAKVRALALAKVLDVRLAQAKGKK